MAKVTFCLIALLVLLYSLAIDYSFSNSGPHGCESQEPGKEYIPAGEAEEILNLVFENRRVHNATYPPGTRSLRDAHPKSHGCVNATFSVLNNIPEEVAVGVFVPGKTYKALIRFSNGNPKVQDDYLPDSRGIAVKLLGVPGEKIMDDEKNADTQDFVAANAPQFFISDNLAYLSFFNATRKGGVDIFKWLLSQGLLRELNLVRKFILTWIGNVVTTRYWSVTPYQLGKKVVKFTFIPVNCTTGSMLSDGQVGISSNYLRSRLTSWLDSQDACFDFGIQFHSNQCDQNIEDSTYTWDEDKAPFTTIARLTIPKQKFDQTQAQLDACDNLSFTPWHSLPEHKPLGSTNRARKLAYQAISIDRHNQNKVPRREP